MQGLVTGETGGRGPNIGEAVGLCQLPESHLCMCMCVCLYVCVCFGYTFILTSRQLERKHLCPKVTGFAPPWLTLHTK